MKNTLNLEKKRKDFSLKSIERIWFIHRIELTQTLDERRNETETETREIKENIFFQFLETNFITLQTSRSLKTSFNLNLRGLTEILRRSLRTSLNKCFEKRKKEKKKRLENSNDTVKKKKIQNETGTVAHCFVYSFSFLLQTFLLRYFLISYFFSVVFFSSWEK